MSSPTFCKSRPPEILTNGLSRELTLNESKAIQSFPDGFIFANEARTYPLIGNSVLPLFMKAIAEHIKNEILVKIDMIDGESELIK